MTRDLNRELNELFDISKLSKAKFGELLGVKQRCIYMWLNNDRTPSMTAILLAQRVVADLVTTR